MNYKVVMIGLLNQKEVFHMRNQATVQMNITNAALLLNLLRLP